VKIAYYDESGDDGYPEYSSPLFVLSAVYLHFQKWQEAYQAILKFRRRLKVDFDLPVKFEMHTKHFLLNKKPYRALGMSNDDRIQILDQFCLLVASLEVRIINVVIVKPRIKHPQYKVLDTCLKYSVQRVENDLGGEDKFMIITDAGRTGKMRHTTRKIQRINFIPSKYTPDPYRREIKKLIEDPLPKDSHQSYFIQLADLVAYVVCLYALLRTKVHKFPNRMPPQVTQETVARWMGMLKPSLNLKASGKDEFGVVFHPE